MPVNPLVFLATAVLAISSGFATAHEFWIDPTAEKYAVGDAIEADIRVGQMMRGSSQPYNENSIKQMGVVINGKPVRLKSRLGDRPAVKLTQAGDGLHVFGVETNASTLGYPEFEKFQTFVETHGQGFAVAEHRAAGLPEQRFKEAYFRYGKTLIPVGSGEGSDQSLRFPFELVAVENPFQTEGPLKFVLLFEGTPSPDHQIDVFQRAVGAGGDAAMTSYQTDANGVVEFPRQSGDHLVNAVKLLRPSASLAEKLDVVWVSLWASTTFTLP